MTITRDVHFSENEQWDWKNSRKSGKRSLEANISPPEEQKIKHWQQEQEDDHPVKGRKLLSDIYQRCNVAIYEPAGPVKAFQDPKWKKIMETIYEPETQNGRKQWRRRSS
uniref:Uncharacterized protein n=1 Tax=Solanum tuberosum TaxID=4113 RepID=M1C9C0_SOLTU